MADKYNPSAASDYDAFFKTSADSNGVSYDLLRKLAWNESRFNPTAKSPTGPRGLMQFTKATGNAYGLVTDEDFHDPQKSIEAGARHLGELVKKYNGDELKAALAYNQGEGSEGGKQLQAYDSGDFSGVSPEGLKYMRNLTDVAKSDKLTSLEQFGGIRPKADAFSVDEATSQWKNAPSLKVGEGLPESSQMDIAPAKSQEVAPSFAEQFWDKHHETVSDAEDKGIMFGLGKASEAALKNSSLGVAIRAGRADNGFDVFKDTITPTAWNSHTWTPEELERIRKEVKNPSYMNVVTGGSPENLDALIKMANDNSELDARAADASAASKVVAGILGAGADPLSYVPIAGNIGKGTKLVSKMLNVGAQVGVASVASEGLRTGMAGGDAHYAQAAIGGVAFGAGLTGIMHGAGKLLGRNDPVPEVMGSAHRLELRESARNADTVDPTRMPIQDGEQVLNHNGVDYVPVPNSADGAVRLKDGTILSGSNPLNPKLQSDFAEVTADRAARGVGLGGLTEIGQKILRSEHNEVRAIGSDLVRAPTGMESGTSGKFGATASDIVERLRSGDNRVYNDLFDAVKETLKDAEWSTGASKMSDAAARQEVYRRASLAIENPELLPKLTKSEKRVHDILKDTFDAKGEMLLNPSVFGRADSPAVLSGTRHAGTYVPNVYSKEAKALLETELGSPEAVQEAIAQSWITSYNTRPEVQKRVDAFLAGDSTATQVTPDMVAKYARDKAYGISHSNEFNGSTVVDDNIQFGEGLVGLENNSFLEARNLFDSDAKVTLPTGREFAVNDIRDFDMRHILPAYNRRVNGDIAIHGSTGKTTAELKDSILELKNTADKTGNGRQRADVDALMDVTKLLTGRSRRAPDNLFETSLRGLTDLSFFAKNAYMGVQNVTEVAGMIAQGNTRAIMHGVPFVRDLVMRNRVVSAKELNELHGVVFGKEIDDLLRPTRQDIIERLRENTAGSNLGTAAVGTFKFGTQELAAKSPWTKLLNGTTNYLMDAGRQGVMQDIIQAALTGKSSRFAKSNLLKSASITKEQYAGIQDLIRTHMTKDADGKYTVKDKTAFANDPRTMDLWRMGDKVADETMLRPHKVSNQDTKSYGAAAKLALQFKSFTIKSMNGKFMRSYYEATKNGRQLDTALTYAVSAGLAASYYVAQAHIKAAGLPKEQQRAYLDKALAPNMIGYATLSRSSHFGAPLGIANMVMAPLGFDQAQMVRSSILPQGAPQKTDKPVAGFAINSSPVSKFVGGVLQQIPAAGWAANAYGTAHNLAGYLNAPNTMTERDYLTGMYNTTRELVPNDPLTQQMLLHMYNEGGIHLDGK